MSKKRKYGSAFGNSNVSIKKTSNNKGKMPFTIEQYIDNNSELINVKYLDISIKSDSSFYNFQDEQAESNTYSDYNYQDDVIRQLKEDNTKLRLDLHKDQVISRKRKKIFIEKQSKKKQKIIKQQQELAAQKQEIIKQQQKLAAQEQEIATQKQEIVEKDRKLIKKKHKISKLENKVVDKDLQVEKHKYNAQKQEKKIVELNKAKSITKPVISESLSRALDTQPSKQTLVNIIKGEIDGNNKFEVLGRTPVKDNKQYRHITPHALLTKALENAFKSSENLKDLYKNFSNIVSIFVKPKGICLREDEYQKLDFVRDIYSRKIITSKNTYYFIDNGKEYFVDCTKTNTTREEATELYQKKYKKYLTHYLAKLAEDINDDNSLTITCELLARFIYTIFNKYSTVSFPDEGNTLNYEIRLYKTIKEAKNCSNQYEIVTVRELDKIINKSGENKISKKIRIVHNEGDIVKKSITALGLLNDIIGKIKSFEDSNEELEQYNNSYNRILKSENLDIDLNKYNGNLDNKNSISTITCHIAKQLYFLFDFKPLENKVFVMSDKNEGIEVLYGTSTKKPSFFKLIDGTSFRDIEKHNYEGTLPCRSEVVDSKLLAEKIITHVNMAILSFEFFSKTFELYNLNYKIIKKFTNLIAHMFKIEKLFEYHVENKLNNDIYNYASVFNTNVNDESLIESILYSGEEENGYNPDIIGNIL